MIKKKFIRLDGDNIGDKIELCLLNENYKEAQQIHFVIQNSLLKIRDKIELVDSIEILMYGADDILFSMLEEDYNIDLLIEIREKFHKLSGFTLSIGVGNTILQAMNNLHKAKLLGKNLIVDEGTSILKN